MKIGTFTLDKNDILHGMIYGLGFGAVPVVFDPQTSKDNKEYFRLIAAPTTEAYEIGVAFLKEKAGMVYHSVSIDSPGLPLPINAALFPDKATNRFNLVWNRPEPQGLKAEAIPNVGSKAHQGRRFPSPKVN